MVILRENNHKETVKKRTQGRKKIEIKKIQNKSNRQVTFSKRRAGLFKKASELCILSGAEIVIVVHSLGKRVFSFGHPSADAVVDRFLCASGEGEECGDHASSTANLRAYNHHYSEVCRELEVEKKRKEVIEEVKNMADGYGGEAMWWDEGVDGMELDELEQYWAALEELMKNVTMRADDLMLIQNSSTLPAAAAAAAAALTLHNQEMEAICDETASLMNQNQTGVGGFDYDNNFMD